MKSVEIDKQMAMSYAELVDYLLKKYGPAKYDYFRNESCRSHNPKVSRASEGLECHHIDEDKAIMLNNSKYAINSPYEYQKADRLVYCNVLEHLILHVKIAEEPKPKGANLFEDPGIGGAVNFICPTLNDFYNGYNFTKEADKKKLSLVADNFDDYIKVLRHLKKVIENNDKYAFFIDTDKLAWGWDRRIIDKIYREL